MWTKRLSSLLTVLALSPIGCGAETDDPTITQSPLLNGQPTSARPEVVQFVSPGGPACTATMISTRTFVASARCINYQPQAIGGRITLPGIGGFNVERAFGQGAGGISDDLSYGRTTAAVPIAPAAIASVEPGAGWLTAIGFGCTTSSCTPPVAKNAVQYWYDGSTPSKIDEFGDSGSPVFAGLLTDGGPLLRVAGGTVIGGFSSVSDYGADAVHFRSFIQAMDTALNTDGISYRSQVQANGWMQAVQNGNVSGITGQSLRLEGLQVWSPRPGVSVCYTAYVQGSGFQPEHCDGDLAGTVGVGLRMEAIKIRLAAKPSGTNGVRYNAYLQGIGWQGWMQDNALAGTTGQSKRIEGIMIQLF